MLAIFGNISRILQEYFNNLVQLTGTLLSSFAIKRRGMYAAQLNIHEIRPISMVTIVNDCLLHG